MQCVTGSGTSSKYPSFGVPALLICEVGVTEEKLPAEVESLSSIEEPIEEPTVDADSESTSYGLETSAASNLAFRTSSVRCHADQQRRQGKIRQANRCAATEYTM